MTESIKKFINPTDRKTEELAQNKAGIRAAGALTFEDRRMLGNTFYNGHQYRDAISHFQYCFDHNPYDYYSRYMIDRCNYESKSNLGNLKLLFNATCAYFMQWFDDKLTSDFDTEFILEDLYEYQSTALKNFDRDINSEYRFNNNSIISERDPLEHTDSYKKMKNCCDNYYGNVRSIFEQMQSLLDNMLECNYQQDHPKFLSEDAIIAQINHCKDVISSYLEKTFKLEFKYSFLLQDNDGSVSTKYGIRSITIKNDETFDDLKQYYDDLIIYCDGQTYLRENNYVEAFKCFKDLDILDAPSLYKTCIDYGIEDIYHGAFGLIREKKYKEAKETFEQIGDYKNTKQLLQRLIPFVQEEDYSYALELYYDKNYEDAKEIFDKLSHNNDDYPVPRGGYKNSYKMSKSCNKKMRCRYFKWFIPGIILYSLLIILNLVFCVLSLTVEKLPIGWFIAALVITFIGGGIVNIAYPGFAEDFSGYSDESKYHFGRILWGMWAVQLVVSIIGIIIS